MQHITSTDGTAIAIDRAGEGPPVVMVVGAFCDRTSGESLATVLASKYTVYRYDRRGRGDSGDTASYSIGREVEDLDAVTAVTDGPPFVYGHSSGGALALEAAAVGVAMRKIAVYEPPYTGSLDPGPEFAQQLDELVARGRRDEAAGQFLALTGAPSHVIDHIKAGSDWPRMRGLAHTLSRDRQLANNGSVPVGRLEHVAVAVLAMAGDVSQPWAREAVHAIADGVASATARVVEGQHHVPADEVLAPILEAFFE